MHCGTDDRKTERVYKAEGTEQCLKYTSTKGKHFT